MTGGLPNNASALCQGQDFVTSSSVSPGLTPQSGAKAGAGGSGRLRAGPWPQFSKALKTTGPWTRLLPGMFGHSEMSNGWASLNHFQSQSWACGHPEQFSPSPLWGWGRGIGNGLGKLQLREPARTRTQRAPWKLRHFSKEIMSLLSPSRQQTLWTGSRQRGDNIIYKLFGKLSEMVDKCLERPAVPTFHPVWKRWW